MNDITGRFYSIDCDLAKRLSLPFVGIREMLGAHGRKNVNVYI